MRVISSIASHADVLRDSSRVSALRTSADLSGKKRRPDVDQSQQIGSGSLNVIEPLVQNNRLGASPFRYMRRSRRYLKSLSPEPAACNASLAIGFVCYYTLSDVRLRHLFN